MINNIMGIGNQVPQLLQEDQNQFGTINYSLFAIAVNIALLAGAGIASFALNKLVQRVAPIIENGAQNIANNLFRTAVPLTQRTTDFVTSTNLFKNSTSFINEKTFSIFSIIDRFREHDHNSFFVACSTGDLAHVQNCIKNGLDVNFSNNNSPTLLYTACFNEQWEVVRYLLEAGADPNKIHNNRNIQNPPFYFAILSRKTEIVKLFIEKGVNLDGSDWLSWTPLITAVAFSNKEIVQVLVDHGVDVNAKDGIGALHVAVQAGDEEIVRILLENGADINAKDINDRTVIHYAFLESKNMVEFLLSYGPDIEARDRNGYTPLHCAATSDNKEIINLLLSKGAKVEAKEDGQRTPLHVAAAKNCIGAIEELIAQGAKIEAKDQNGLTSLHVAAYEGSADAAEVLIKNGANLTSLSTINGWTPIHLAAKQGHENVVEKLIVLGIDQKKYLSIASSKRMDHLKVGKKIPKNIMMDAWVSKILNQADSSGNTPLHIAVEQNQKDFVAFLLRFSVVNNKIPNAEGKTPLQIAQEKDFNEIETLLKNKRVAIHN